METLKKSKMRSLLLNNILILYLGALLRYIYVNKIKRKNIEFDFILHGFNNPKTKSEEMFNIQNSLNNRLCAFVFTILLVSKVSHPQ